MNNAEKEKALTALECWEAVGFAKDFNNETLVEIFVKKDENSGYFKRWIDITDRKHVITLGLDITKLDDPANSSNNIDSGALLLVIDFTHVTDNCANPTLTKDTETLRITSPGKPFYIATILNGREKRYKRRTQAIVTEGPTVDFPFVTHGQ